MLLAMPESLRAEHEDLRAELDHALRLGGRLGEAARMLESPLRAHLRREDDNVHLALGLLQSVADGKIAPAMREVVVIVDRLKIELPQMLAEHAEIEKALDRLGQVATQEARPRIAYFAAKLLRHARMEEEVLYPAAIVLGEYLKSRLAPDEVSLTADAVTGGRPPRGKTVSE